VPIEITKIYKLLEGDIAVKGDHQSDIQTTLVTRTQKIKMKSLSI